MTDIPADIMEKARELACAVAADVDGCTCVDCLDEAQPTIARALLSEREANAKRIAELEAGLRYCGEAIDTGRSEPLFVARDLIRNTLLKETGDV
jgi:hypothetical protein